MNRKFTLQVLRGINLDWEKTKVPSKLREFCSRIPSVRAVTNIRVSGNEKTLTAHSPQIFS